MSARIRRLPPGRVGLMWLARRIAVADRGGDLLEHKLRILLAEEQNYALAAERTRREWEQSIRELQTWMLRSAIISGESGVRLATPGRDCDVAVEWRVTMGVRYPASATCRPAPLQQEERLVPNTALFHAAPAATRAAKAGVDHAVAERALMAIQQEIAATRRQLRALRERWLPALESERQRLVIALEDAEHEEHVRLRWAAPGGRRGAR
jgi:V/A-type H+-transporting ATPase subunit D